VREDRDGVAAALGRRGVDRAEVDRVADLDTEARERVRAQEQLRAQVNELSRRVRDARRSGEPDVVDALSEQSRKLGEHERELAAAAESVQHELREALLMLPNLPAEEVPDGAGPDDNVELRRWWPGIESGRPAPEYEPHQRVPHWEIGRELGLLDLERGVRLSGSMFPLYRGMGSRLLRALSALALSRHVDAYEEIRPPTFVLTETMTATGHLPRFADEGYYIERDGLWAIPTAEVPLTSLYRGEILDEAELPMRFCAATACFRREAGAAGRDTRGLVRTHEFDKVELMAYATPEQAASVHADITARAEALLRELGLQYQVLDLCAGDLSAPSARTLDLEVFGPSVDHFWEVSSVSWYRDYQARRANIRYRPSGGGPPAFVHTLNGSALAWSRIWPALVETGRRPDGAVELPECLAPYLGGETVITPP
jgi:seryl-tRNA synthetase